MGVLLCSYKWKKKYTLQSLFLGNLFLHVVVTRPNCVRVCYMNNEMWLDTENVFVCTNKVVATFLLILNIS